jgi:hypothetical protein
MKIICTFLRIGLKKQGHAGKIVAQEGKPMKSFAEYTISALARRAGIGRGWINRIERIALHIVFMALVADRLGLIVRAAQGIAREVKGI